MRSSRASPGCVIEFPTQDTSVRTFDCVLTDFLSSEKERTMLKIPNPTEIESSGEHRTDALARLPRAKSFIEPRGDLNGVVEIVLG